MPLSLPSPTSPAWPNADALLQAVLDVSLSGLVLYSPVYDAAGQVTDFTFDYLNPAARQILKLDGVPTQTHLELFPPSATNGGFDFHRRAFDTGEPGYYELLYQAGGLDNYFRCAARRVGNQLLVSFTDTADQPRTDVEEALRQSQAREQAARAEAEAQRQQLQNMIMQAPACIASMEGPELRFTLVNPLYQQLVGTRTLVGKPLREAWPELEGQPFFALLEGVYRTGETYYGNEQIAYLDRTNTGRLDPVYFNFIYQAVRDAAGQVTGVVIFAYDVSEQVQARKLTEAQEQHTNLLNEELAAANEELAATNEELHASHAETLAHNVELNQVQHSLQQLNQDLENRVQQRTQDLQAAQVEAERQRQRLENLFMRAPAAICILAGPELVFELVNPRYQRLLPDRPLLGRPFLEAVPELAQHPVMDVFRQIYATGITHEEVATLVPLARASDGVLEDRYFNYIQQPRFDEQGQVDGVLVFAFEVTAQVQARQASEESARRLRLLTDALPVLISYLDREERYRFANLAYKAWFNQEPEQLLGRPAREIIGEAAYAGIQNYIHRALAGERLDFEARMPYRDDFVKYIRTSYVPDVQQGQVAGFYTVISDITESVLARQQVQHLNEELAAINEELQASNEELMSSNQQLIRINADLDNFIYTASHDLKSPISNIEGLLYALREELPPEAQTADNVGPILARMLDSVNRFKRTISHLTEVSKLQKEHAPSTTPVELGSVIDDVCLDLAPVLQQSRAELVVDVAGCPPVLFSEKNLRSVVYNLLSNALKYQHPDRRPRIELRCRTEDGFTILEVHDNGLGIDEGQQARLFSMFQRFHDHVEGSGIGLYMVKKMVENGGGRIEVQSRPGLGSTFYVYFRTYPA